MARKVIDTFWDRKTRNDINDNFKELYEGLTGDIDGGRLADNSVEGSALADGAVSPEKTSFFKGGDKNYFNGVYKDGLITYNHTNGRLRLRSNYDDIKGKIAIIPVEPNKSYYFEILEKNKSNVLRAGLHNKEVNIADEPYLNKLIFTNSAGDPEKSVSFTTGNNDHFLYVYVSNSGQEPKAKLSNYQIPLALIEKDETEKIIKPLDTSFFKGDSGNLFDGMYYDNLTFVPNGGNGFDWVKLTSAEHRYSVIIQIEESETYTVTKFEGGNRFNIALINSIPTNNSVIAVESHQGEIGSSAKQVYTFTNDIGAEYLWVQTNLGDANIPKIQIEKGSESTPYKSPPYIPVNYLDPSLKEFLIKRDYKFNLPMNLFELYKRENPIEDYIENPEELTVEEYHTMFGDVITQHSSIAKRTKLGDVTGDFPLYLYETTPPQYWVDYTNDSGGNGGRPVEPPTFIFTTGIHGHERSPSISAYYFFKDLLENPNGNELVDFIKMNVRIVCIPLANPSGWTDGTYENRNKINLNRQFPPFVDNPTEPEAILIKQVIDNANMDFFIDFHNMYFRDGYIGYTLTSSDVFKYSMNNIYRNLGRKWAKENPDMPQEIDHVWGYNSIPNVGTVGNYVQTQLGVESMLMEVIRNNTWLGGGAFSEPVARLGLEFMVNAILSALRTRS